MSETRRYYIVDLNDGETIGEVDLGEEEIDEYSDVADALGFYLAE
jgi:hypothetical protein